MRIGLLLMAAAMLVVPCVDVVAKHLSQEHSSLQVAWARYAAASLFVLPVTAMRFGWALVPDQNRVVHVLRTMCIVASMSLYFVAISTAHLSSALSVFFVAPVAAAGLAIVFFGEKLSRHKIAGLLLGGTGTAITLGTWTAQGLSMWLALGAGLLFAVFLLLTRWATKGAHPLRTLAFQCLLGTVLLTPQAIVTWSTPTWPTGGFFLLMGALSAASHGLMIGAFRFADASTLAPLVYMELAGAIVLGFLVFGEVPGTGAMFGAGMIVCAGLCLLWVAPPSNNNDLIRPDTRLRKVKPVKDMVAHP